MLIKPFINWVLGLLIILGIPTLIAGIIMVCVTKKPKTKKWGIALICILPGSIIFLLLSSLIFGLINYNRTTIHNHPINNYTNNHTTAINGRIDASTATTNN